MEIERYIIPLRRWWWLLLAATLLAAISSFLATLRQAPLYQARTTLLIGQTINDPNPSTNEFMLGSQLAAYYADIANREPVRNATMEVLGLRGLPEYLASAVPNGQFVEIVVNDTIPVRAQAVANELAHQLTLLSPTSVDEVDQDRQGFITEQLNTLEAQIEETQLSIEELQGELGNLVSASQIADTQTQINGLQTKLTTMQTIYADLLATTNSEAFNSLTIIEPAALPARPIGPQKGLTVLLAAVVGFLLAAGAAYLLEYIDDTLKSPADVSRVMKLPIIGYIAEMAAKDEAEKGIYVQNHPRSPVAEAFRALRTNLEFSAVDKPLKTILVTSASGSAGKTSVALNLAEIMAQGEKRIILLEADLRRPRMREYLRLPDGFGLADVFRGRINVLDAINRYNNDNLSVITSGNEVPNPAELLGSKKMGDILSKLGEKADYIIIDGPPFLVADAPVLASKVDGVILVVRPGLTREGEVRAMLEQIQRSGARVLGITLNGLPRKSLEGIGLYQYDSPYYSGDQSGEGGAAKHKSERFPIQSWIGKFLKRKSVTN
jgi:capsular exopolysaccharide synthesis family protein